MYGRQFVDNGSVNLEGQTRIPKFEDICMLSYRANPARMHVRSPQGPLEPWLGWRCRLDKASLYGIGCYPILYVVAREQILHKQEASCAGRLATNDRALRPALQK